MNKVFIIWFIVFVVLSGLCVIRWQLIDKEWDYVRKCIRANWQFVDWQCYISLIQRDPINCGYLWYPWDEKGCTETTRHDYPIDFNNN